MFDDLLTQLSELHNNVEFSRRFLKTLETYRERLVKQIEVAESTLKSLMDENGKYKAQTIETIVNGIKEDAKFILQSEIIAAVQKNREFAFPLFLNALLGAAENPEIIKISITGTGKSAKIRADIDMLGIAGGLEDWARGVVETRQFLKISRGADAQRASAIWREKIFQNPQGPYYKTIEERVSRSGKPASFWLLLDKGTTTLASDRGGTAFPNYTTPTNFVDRAKTKIEKQFRTQYEQFLQDSNKETSVLQEELNRAKEYLPFLDNLVSQISAEIEKNKELYSKFAKVSTYVDQNKLDNVLARIRLDLGVNVTAEGRVELGISSARRYRPYLTTLQAIVGGG